MHRDYFFLQEKKVFLQIRAIFQTQEMLLGLANNTLARHLIMNLVQISQLKSL